jgi:hypothetical protein
MSKYTLPAVMPLPAMPLKEDELLQWAKQVQAILQNTYIPQTDRIENMIMSEDGIGRRPAPIGSRRLFYDRTTQIMYMDKQVSENVAEWEPVGGTGIGAFLPLAGGTMLGDILMLDNALIWEDQSPTPLTYHPVMDWNGLYWEDDAVSPTITRFLGLFHDGLRLDDLSKIYYEDATSEEGSGTSFDIMWFDGGVVDAEDLHLNSGYNLVLSAGSVDPLAGHKIVAESDLLLTASVPSSWNYPLHLRRTDDVVFGLVGFNETTTYLGFGGVDSILVAKVGLYANAQRPFYFRRDPELATDIALLSDIPGVGEIADPEDAMYQFALADGMPNKYMNYSVGVLDTIEYYDATPTKMYEKQFNYTGGILTSIVLTRLSDMETWTKTLTYDVDEYLPEVEAA